LRRNTYTSVFNSIFTDFPTGLHIDGSASQANVLADSLRFENNLFAGMGTGKNLDASSPATIRNWYNANNNDTLSATTGLFVNPYNFTNGDYRLAAGSPAFSTSADFTDSFIGLSSNCTNAIADLVKNEFELAVYPNPANHSITIEFDVMPNTLTAIEVIDITGKQVLSILQDEELSVGTNRVSANVNALANGLYFVKVKSGNTVNTKKLIINK